MEHDITRSVPQTRLRPLSPIAAGQPRGSCEASSIRSGTGVADGLTTPKDDTSHLDRMRERYAEARQSIDELATNDRNRTPMHPQFVAKTIVFSNGALAFVELEMKAAGLVNFGTDLDNPNF